MSQPILIEFLYLDLSVCQRCQSTESALMSALESLSDQLSQDGIAIELRKINVNTANLAIQHRFVSSPTIRVNGRDLADTLEETLCEDCGNLCGDLVNCRVWHYQGQQFSTPPVAMIKEAVLKSLKDPSPLVLTPYVLPDNLKTYYEGLSHTSQGPTITLTHL